MGFGFGMWQKYQCMIEIVCGSGCDIKVVCFQCCEFGIMLLYDLYLCGVEMG